MFDKRKLKNALRYYCYHQSHTLGLLIEHFDLNNYQYAILGGFVRKILNCKRSRSINMKDIDIVIDLPKSEIKYILRHYKIKFTLNDFGGFKILPDPEDTFTTKIDLWSMNDHYPFKYGLLKKSWKNLSKSSWISLDSAVWIPKSNKLYARFCKKSLKKREVNLTVPLDKLTTFNVPFKGNLFGKVIYYVEVVNFNLGESLREALLLYCRHHTMEFALKFLEKNYNDNQFIDGWKNILKKYPWKLINS